MCSYSHAVGGNQGFPRTMRKAFQGPTHRRLCCGRMVYSHGRLPLSFQFLISLHLTVDKVQPCLQQGQNKGWCPKFLLHIKAQSFRTHAICCRPQSLLNPQGPMVVCYCMKAWGEGGFPRAERGEERERQTDRHLICSPGIVLA